MMNMQKKIENNEKTGMKKLKNRMVSRDSEIEEFVVPEEWEWKYLGESDIEAGQHFIEEGTEYMWLKRMYGPVEDDDGEEWYVWAAVEYVEDEEKQPRKHEGLVFFVVDEDDGFIDWGPEDAIQPAIEFCDGKAYEEDVEEEELLDSKNVEDARKTPLQEAMLDAIEALELDGFTIPKNFIWEDIDDLKDGIVMGIDSDVETAENILEWLKKANETNRKLALRNKEFAEDDPMFESLLDAEKTLQKELDAELKKYEEPKKPVEVEDDLKAADLFGKGNFTKHKGYYIVKNDENQCYDIYDPDLEIFEVGLDSISEAKTIVEEEI